VEGYRNLLVHGPLTVVLILSALRARLQKGEMVLKLDYRNLAPLYAEEEMMVCVRRDPEKAQNFDVWIEGKEGGYAVKGRAVVGMMDTSAKPAEVRVP
jgi:hydroxyacyl-ACP dehydratase HTD2-like protein with hotdog domain